MPEPARGRRVSFFPLSPYSWILSQAWPAQEQERRRMKAEHRKELQTNTLADNLGRLITGSRSMSRRTVLVLVAIVVLGVGVFVWTMIQNNNNAMRAEAYYYLDQGNFEDLREKVIAANPESEPAKLAHFQIAWVLLWKEGIEPLAKSPSQAKERLAFAQGLYQRLAKDAENDPVLLAEAQYALALIEESLAATESSGPARNEKVGSALSLYRALASDEKLKDTAHGQQAKARAEYLEKNRTQVVAFYDQLAGRSPPDLQEILRQFKQKEQEQKDQKK
jgi:hypothetical protein